MRISIILVSPKVSGNIGAIARVMANFGLDDLRLVRPRALPEEEEARWRAMGGLAILENARKFSSLAQALDDCTLSFAFTAREGKRRKRILLPSQINERLSSDYQAAFVFGPEDQGLCSRDLRSCSHLVHIPLPGFEPSLNLSHAVAIALYSLISFSPESEMQNEKIGSKRKIIDLFRLLGEKTKFINDANRFYLMGTWNEILNQGLGSNRRAKILAGWLQALARCLSEKMKSEETESKE